MLIKRILDFIISLVHYNYLSPLMLIIYVLVMINRDHHFCSRERVDKDNSF